MSNWSDLPFDILSKVADHLSTESNLIRFRSVCSSWRSSLFKHHRPNHRPDFPVVPGDGLSVPYGGFSIVSRTVFLLSNPYTPSATSRLVKVEETSPGRYALLDPLSRRPLPSPRFLDLIDLHIVELGREYLLRKRCLSGISPGIFGGEGEFSREKVVFRWLNDIRQFIFLAITRSKDLAVLRDGDTRWGIIPGGNGFFKNLVLYKGEFYAVDVSGRCFVVGLNMELNLVAGPVFGADMQFWHTKFLVESLGELLLVNDSRAGGFVEASRRATRFYVYRLELECRRWVEVTDLGDQVLFLGKDCRFSASAKELGVPKGNSIFFRCLKGAEVGVYDMDTHSLELLENRDGYSQLFSLSPEWLTSGNCNVRVRQTDSSAVSTGCSRGLLENCEGS